MRIEIGPRDVEKGEFVAVRRDTSVKTTLKIDTAVESVTKLLEEIHDSMYRKYETLHGVSEKRHPFYFCDIFVIFHLILLFFWQKHNPGNLKQTPRHGPVHI